MTGTHSDHRQDRLRRFAAIVELFGADSRRWPAAERSAMLALVACNGAARRLLAEAQALDTVLARAPASHPTADLAAGIVASARAMGQQDGESPARVLRLDRATPGVRRPLYGRLPRRGVLWRSAALLAASFAFGVYLGLSGLALPALSDVAILAAADGDLGAALGSLGFDADAILGSEQL